MPTSKRKLEEQLHQLTNRVTELERTNKRHAEDAKQVSLETTFDCSAILTRGQAHEDMLKDLTEEAVREALKGYLVEQARATLKHRRPFPEIGSIKSVITKNNFDYYKQLEATAANSIKQRKAAEANSTRQDKATTPDPLSLTTMATGGAYAAEPATGDESHTNKNLEEVYERSNAEITSKLKDLELRLSRIANIPDQLKKLREDVSRLESIEIARMKVGVKTKANQEKNSALLEILRNSTTENLTDLKEQLHADARL